MPGGSKHIPRKFYPPQSSHICLRRRRSCGGHGLACPSSLSLVFVFPQLLWPSYEPLDCPLGCLEGTWIFLKSFIQPRVLIFVCGEGEVSQSGFTVPRAQLLIPWYAALFVMLLAVQKANLGKSGQFSGVLFNPKQVLLSWVWPENDCVKS